MTLHWPCLLPFAEKTPQGATLKASSQKNYVAITLFENLCSEAYLTTGTVMSPTVLFNMFLARAVFCFAVKLADTGKKFALVLRRGKSIIQADACCC